MIKGIGSDIVQISRIAGVYRKNEAFAEKILTVREQQELSQRHNKIEYLAGRWAAKEAVGKALKCGIGSGLKKIEIISDKNGAPQVYLYDGVKKTAIETGVKTIHISISHEREYALAVVVLEG